MIEEIFSIVVFIIAMGVYMLPTIVGSLRKKKNIGAIAVLNFFLGWTVIGWIVALMWAVAHEGK